MDKFLNDLPNNNTNSYLDFISEDLGSFDEVVTIKTDRNKKDTQKEEVNVIKVNTDTPKQDNKSKIQKIEKGIEVKQKVEDKQDVPVVENNTKPVFNFKRDLTNGGIVIHNINSKVNNIPPSPKEENEDLDCDRLSILKDLLTVCTKEVSKLAIEIEINEELLRTESNPIERKMLTSRIESLGSSSLKNKKRKKVIDKFIYDLNRR